MGMVRGQVSILSVAINLKTDEMAQFKVLGVGCGIRRPSLGKDVGRLDHRDNHFNSWSLEFGTPCLTCGRF